LKEIQSPLIFKSVTAIHKIELSDNPTMSTSIIPGRLATPLQLTHKSISTIHTEYLSGSRLDLSPSYQRARCWTQSQNNGLIASIMLNWPTPLMTFYKLHPSNPDDATAYAAGHRYECVDGQNRLCAIRAFLTGSPIVSDKGKEEAVTWIATDGDIGSHYAAMPEAHRELFGEYVVAVTIIQEPMSLEDRKRMFTRLQDGTKISASEYVKNSEHPVSLFVSKTGLRDRFLPVVTGFMAAAKGDWMDVLADCVTLWFRRAEAAPIEFLRRTQSELRSMLKKPRAVAAESPYSMLITEADHAPMTAVFDRLLEVLASVKADKIKCHKFHVSALFLALVQDLTLPSVSALRKWLKATSDIVSRLKLGENDTAIRVDIQGLLMAEEDSDSESTGSSKPKRRAIPKKKREALWIRHFGALEADGSCLCCQAHIAADKWEQAHIVAVANNGTNDLSNLVPTCVSCNRSCGDEDLREFAAREWPQAPLLRSASA
jgi:hypothetical protein